MSRSHKTFRCAPFICAPTPATPHSQALAATASKKMDKELSEYIVKYYETLFTGRETLWLKQLRHQYVIESSSDKNDVDRKIQLYKSIGWLTDDREILELVKGGQEALNQTIAERIMTEYSNKIFINNCPNCGRLARTPFAKQCRHCGHGWR